MYCDFYEMTERPFAVTPDPKCLYLNARYREALAALHYGITQRKGFITLIGEAGTGKTTLLKRLLEDFDPKTRSVFIFNTHVTFEEILEYLFAEFDLPVHNGKKLYMLQRLNTFLLEELRGGGNVALLIDEAQDLEYSVLEDLRLLSNLETAKEKILQIVLSGQPELGDKLSNPNLRQLRQRIAVSCRLLPLSREEISEYIQFRLHAVGCSDVKLFSRDAEDQIYHFSRGIPRLINVVCDNALVIGYALGKKRIGGDVISEAAADLMPVQEPAAHEVAKDVAPTAATLVAATAARPRTRLALVVVVLVAISIGLLSVGRSMLKRATSNDRANTRVSVEAAPARPAEVIRPGSLPRPGTEVEPAPANASGREPAAPVDVAPPRAAVDPAVSAAVGDPPPAADSPAEPKRTEGDLKRPAPVEPVAVNGGRTGEAGSAMAAEPPAVVARANVPAMAPTPINLWKEVNEDNVRRDAEPRIQTPRNERLSGPSEDTATVRLAANQFDRVIVQPGDSISRIAIKKYGQSSLTILDLMKLANPSLHDINVIAVGQTIQLPDLTESSVLAMGERSYGVLVYSTTQASRAAALDSALRARGHHSSVRRADLGAHRPVLRVVLDGYTDRAAAVAASREVQRLFREDGRLALLLR